MKQAGLLPGDGAGSIIPNVAQLQLSIVREGRMHLQHSLAIAAPAEVVWGVTIDVERWPEWTPTMEKVERLDGGPFQIGSQARIKQPQFNETVWTVLALVPGAELYVDCADERADDGCVARGGAERWRLREPIAARRHGGDGHFAGTTGSPRCAKGDGH